MAQNFVLGAKSLENILKELPDKVARKVVLAGLRAGATPIVKEMNRLAPRDSGLLATAGTSRTRKLGRGKSAPKVVSIGFKKTKQMVARKDRKKLQEETPSRIAHLAEFGTEHSAPEPFIRPALDGKGQEAISRITEFMARGVEREARKLAGKK